MPLKNFLITALCLLLLGACTPTQQPMQAPPNNDLGGGTGADTTSGPNVLSYAAGDSFGQPCVNPCSLIAQPNSSLALPVRYTKADGTPIAGAEVQYVSTLPANMGKLSQPNTLTDTSGQAMVGLVTYAQAKGVYQVTASVPGDPAAGQLVFQVTLKFQEETALIVNFQYTGKQPITQFGARLYRQNNSVPSCADINPDAPLIGAQPLLIDGPNLLNQSFIFQNLPDLDTMGAQMWTIQIVSPNQGPVQAIGCNQNVQVKYNITETVNIEVNDMPLKFNGNHKLTTHVDMHSGLSGGAAETMGVVIGLFIDPGGTIIKKACTSASGFLSTLCGQLLDDNDPSGLSPNGKWAADAASNAFFGLIEKQYGPGFLNGGQTIANLFKDLRLGSTMALIGEPTVASEEDSTLSYADGKATEVWETASFYWKFNLNCPPGDEFCGLQTIKLSDVYTVPLGAKIMPVVDTKSQIAVPIHLINGFAYGVLVNFMLEKKVLPLLFGDGSDGLPPVDSYDKMIAIVLGDQYCLSKQNCCELFQQKMVIEFGGTLGNILGLACDSLVSSGAEWIRDNLIGMEGDLSVGTPENTPCPAFDFTGDRYVDNLGAATPVPERCHWDMTWQLSGDPFKPNSRWYGKK
jgi:hypothetical protein